MVFMSELWLPILVSAVIVFAASSIIHMATPMHRNDRERLAHESDVLAALRTAQVRPGDYFFPYATTKEMGQPEVVEKFKQGPVGFATILPNGPVAIGRNLALWFVYSVVMGMVVAYVTGRTLGPGADYLAVFRVAGTVAFLGYAGSEAHMSIWWGRPWLTTLKNTVDGLIYGLGTAGAFGWLWPR